MFSSKIAASRSNSVMIFSFGDDLFFELFSGSRLNAEQRGHYRAPLPQPLVRLIQ